MTEITTESLKTLDIKALALDKERFGPLTFDSSLPLLEKLREIFVELKEFEYGSTLPTNIAAEIKRQEPRFIDYLKRISTFDLKVDPNFKYTHDNYENEVQNFYDEIFRVLAPYLTYLRQEAALKSRDTKELQRQQKATLQAEKDYKDLAEKLKQELEALRKQKGEVETAHGEVAAKMLAVQFDRQAKEDETAASKWLLLRNVLYWTLIGIIGANFIAYLLLFILNKTGKVGLAPLDIFTIEYGVVKLALLAVLSYGVGFASKNYNVNSHLAAANKHRRNVAQTLEDFLATNPDRKAEMLHQGTAAMFKHVAIGYIKREEQKDAGPIYEIVNKLLPSKEQ